MRRLLMGSLVVLGVAIADESFAAKWAIVVHGGAGVSPLARHRIVRARIEEGIEAALKAGRAVLEEGGAAIDAVEAAIVVLEDDPLFNAGRGAVRAGDGRFQLDASIMTGSGLRGAGVACVERTRNPIRLARAVMGQTRHVLLVGPDAERFGVDRGLQPVDPTYFDSADAWLELRLRAGLLDPPERQDAEDVGGTVGCVALDVSGELAAGTSTGGLSGKMPGRVGDSPLLGAGTYAKEGVCALSGTGVGEEYIRAALAARVAFFVEQGSTIRDACDRVLGEIPPRAGG